MAVVKGSNLGGEVLNLDRIKSVRTDAHDGNNLGNSMSSEFLNVQKFGAARQQLAVSPEGQPRNWGSLN